MKIYEKPVAEIVDFTAEKIMSGEAGATPTVSEGVEI